MHFLALQSNSSRQYSTSLRLTFLLFEIRVGLGDPLNLTARICGFHYDAQVSHPLTEVEDQKGA